jgi:hypothetical protein
MPLVYRAATETQQCGVILKLHLVQSGQDVATCGVESNLLSCGWFFQRCLYHEALDECLWCTELLLTRCSVA